MSDTDTAGSPAAPTAVTVTLVEPIARASGAVGTLMLRKPAAGEMRGLKLQDLMQADIGAILTLIPRIADPFITEVEAAKLSSEDIAEIGGTIVGFFMSPAQKAMIAQFAGG